MTNETDNGSDAYLWREVLAFWFPEGQQIEVDTQTHRDHWFWRMRGGADSEIRTRFAELTERGANGELDHWAADPNGRLALIIVLDQFSRSLWRNTPHAFAQDKSALSLTLEGLTNGHYAALAAPWYKVVHGLPLGHCEGPDHLQRIDRLIALRTAILAQAPAHLQSIYTTLVKQAQDVRQVIAVFGRHPHRNRLLSRHSTPAEEAYIAEGKFPHLKAFS